MISLSFIVRYCPLLPIIMILLIHGIPSNCAAQNDKTTLNLTIFIVPEKEACRKNGYKNYDDEKTSSCEKLTMYDIRTFRKKYGEIYQESDIPPNKITLIDGLYRILDFYRDVRKITPEKRKSLVFVFDFKKPMNCQISLMRIVQGRDTDIPPMIWEDEVVNYEHWIHHERADALDPLEKIEWVLNVTGLKPWTFYTGR